MQNGTVMKKPMGPSPTRHVWLHESLVDDARRLWEQMVAELRNTARQTWHFGGGSGTTLNLLDGEATL
jgi:hypothetical protein